MHEILFPSFRDRTTLHLGGTALAELIVERPEELPAAFERARELGGRPFFLGRGSNLLARDGTLEIVIIRMAFADRIEITESSQNEVQIAAGASVPLARLLRFCLSNSISGLEAFVGIPGSVGGACAMNAGSFGDAIGNKLTKLQIYSEGQIKDIDSKEIHLHYRKIKIENFNDCPLITRATFTLTRGLKNVILQLMNLNFLQKKSRQPLAAWSAGSTFKNPAGSLSAWRLIEMAGFKGMRKGGMAFSDKHANFMINLGNGTSCAALELMDKAIDGVHRISGIWLEPEVKIVP